MPFDPRQFCDEALEANGINVAFGVPDSVLDGLSSYLSATKSMTEHIVMASEGGAVALAAGYHLTTGKLALVYMQNSGLANALNPLLSLAAKEVFGIPMLLMIGWRGKPGVKDEPQHASIGPRLLEILTANDLPYEELPKTMLEARESIARLIATSRQRKSPVALIIPPQSFSGYGHDKPPGLSSTLPYRSTLQNWTSDTPELPLSRETAIRCVLQQVRKTDIMVCSLGGATRELYMIRKEKGESMSTDFMCIGAMGHTFALAHGIAMGSSSRRVLCIDGDGSFLMHVGNNAVLADISRHDVVHVIMYNGTYGSTGDQPLMLSKTNFIAMAEGLPYQQKILVDRAEMLEKACASAQANSLIIVTVNTSVREGLPRPSGTPRMWKDAFMGSLL